MLNGARPCLGDLDHQPRLKIGASICDPSPDLLRERHSAIAKDSHGKRDHVVEDLDVGLGRGGRQLRRRARGQSSLPHLYGVDQMRGAAVEERPKVGQLRVELVRTNLLRQLLQFGEEALSTGIVCTQERQQNVEPRFKGEHEPRCEASPP